MQLEVVATRVSTLDRILPGGFLKGGVYIIDGAPGTGKTILSSQICFNRRPEEGKALFVTLLAESHTRMLQHLRPMSFYTESVLPHQLYFVSGSAVLASDGLAGLLELLKVELRRHRPSVLVIDGFAATREAARSDLEFKRFVQEIQSHAAAGDCVVLLLTSGADGAMEVTHTVVDGILRLTHQLFDRQTERTLQVVKFRGRDFLPGKHSFRITNDGVVIYPRVEALFATPSVPDEYALSRRSTGIEGVDAMLGGGLLARTTNGLFGPTGIGKTSFGLQYVSRSSAAEPGVFFGLFESPSRLRAKAQAIGIDLQELERREQLELIWRPQGERLLDELGHEIVAAIHRRKAKRVFIDGFGGLVESVIGPERLARFISSLANEIRALGAMTLVSIESPDILGANMALPGKGLSSLLEGLIVMRYAEVKGEIRRLIAVTKVRDSEFDPFLREFKITSRGLQVGDTMVGCEALMSGFGRDPRATT